MTNAININEFRAFHCAQDILERTKLNALQPSALTSHSGKLAEAFDNCGMNCAFDWDKSPSFNLYRQIWQAVCRCKEIDAMGLSGLAATMFQRERQEYRDLQVWLRQTEILLGETNMRAIYPSLPESI